MKAIFVMLILAALASCGIKGDPLPIAAAHETTLV